MSTTKSHLRPDSGRDAATPSPLERGAWAALAFAVLVLVAVGLLLGSAGCSTTPAAPPPAPTVSYPCGAVPPPKVDWEGRAGPRFAAAAPDAGPASGVFSGTLALRPDDAGGFVGSFTGASWPAPDGGPAIPDSGPADTGPAPDAGPADTGPAPDAGPMPDAGYALGGVYEAPLSPPTGAPTGKTVATTPLALPAVGTRVTEPDFKTTLRRGPAGYVTVYSQSRACTTDGLYCLLVKPNVGFTVFRYADWAQMTNPSMLGTPKWMPGTHMLLHTDVTPARVYMLDVDKGTDTLVATLTGYNSVSSNESYEDTSEDGKSVALFLMDMANKRWFTVWDTTTWTLQMRISLDALFGGGGCTPDPQWGVLGPDWSSVSLDRDFLVVQWTRDGTARCAGNELYNAGSGAFVRQISVGHQHGDLGRDAAGKQTYASFNVNGNYAGLEVAALDGSYRKIVRSLAWNTMGHVSCRGQSGRCVISAGTAAEFGGPFGGETYVVAFDGSANRLAHHRSTEWDGYWTEPKCTWANTRVLCSTDWGTSGAYETFVLEFTPSGVFAQPAKAKAALKPIPPKARIRVHNMARFVPPPHFHKR